MRLSRAKRKVSKFRWTGPPAGKVTQPQEMVLEGLTPGRQYFALKSWDAAESIIKLSNVVSVEVKQGRI